jgi:type II secretory pathway pseudopilin PulG
MRHSFPTRRRGFALEATLAVLLLLVVLSAAAATGAATMVRTSTVDQSATRVNYAVDAAADNMMSQLLFIIQRFGVPTQARLDSLRRPQFAGGTLEGISITQSARRVGAATNDSIRGGPFAGLVAQYASYDLDITATDRASNSSRAIVRVESQLIPIFQFGVFFEKDLEVTAGQVFTFLGRVHTNGNLYLCPDAPRMYFLEYLTTPNRYFQNRKNENDTGCSRTGGSHIIMSRTTPTTAPPIPADTGRITFDNRGSGNTTCCSSPANYQRFRDSSQVRLGGRLQTIAHGVDSLNLPLPGDSIDPRELIRPRSNADNAAMRLVKYAWMADWQLTVDWNDIGSLCANIQNSAWSVRPLGREVPDAARCSRIFGFATFRDDREGATIRALTINADTLRAWVLGDTARRNVEIMYITFTGANNPAEPRTQSTGLGAGTRFRIGTVDFEPAVRIQRAAMLHGPFTLATSHPLYVYGDYNFDRTTMSDTASKWRPSSLVSDAITFLSPAWLDANNVGAGSNNDNASSLTYVRAAIAAGHSPTYRASGNYDVANSDWFVVGSDTRYGGGLENFPRFLENFSSRTVNFGGSLVSLWYSAYANWNWGGSYYSPPTRVWSFDTRFRLPQNWPPGTPKVGSVYQIAYRPVY